MRRIGQNHNACFCVVGHTLPHPAGFTTEYESVLVFGSIFPVRDDAERMRALGYLVEKYSPGFQETGRKYAEKSFHRTAVLRLDIDRISGKSKCIP